MSGIWISAATIARFAAAGSLMTLMAGGRYGVRLHASDILEKLGFPRGHVLRRQGNSETLPDPRKNTTCTNPKDSCRWEAP